MSDRDFYFDIRRYVSWALARHVRNQGTCAIRIFRRSYHRCDDSIIFLAVLDSRMFQRIVLVPTPSMSIGDSRMLDWFVGNLIEKVQRWNEKTSG